MADLDLREEQIWSILNSNNHSNFILKNLEQDNLRMRS